MRRAEQISSDERRPKLFLRFEIVWLDGGLFFLNFSQTSGLADSVQSCYLAGNICESIKALVKAFKVT